MQKFYSKGDSYTWSFPDKDKHFIKVMSQSELPYQYKHKRMITDRMNMLDLSWVLDVGANVGLWTRFFAGHGAKRIDCFEPGPEALECLKSNTADLSGIAIHEIALGEFSGTSQMYGVGDSGFNTFSPTGKMVAYQEVPIQTLDEFNLEPTFIKVDIQESEMAFLRGAKNTLSKHKPGIIIEGERDNIEQESLMFLRALGYRLECALSSDYLMVYDK